MKTANRKRATVKKAQANKIFAIEHDPKLESSVSYGVHSKLVEPLLDSINDLEVNKGHIKLLPDKVVNKHGAEALVQATRRRIKRNKKSSVVITVKYVSDTRKRFQMAVVKRIN
jgi:predicted nicotinamide N-methyase